GDIIFYDLFCHSLITISLENALDSTGERVPKCTITFFLQCGSTSRNTLLTMCAVVLFSILIFYIQSSFFVDSLSLDRNSETICILSNSQSSVQQCVPTTLDAMRSLRNLNLWSTMMMFEQNRNMTTMLIREYLDARYGGWMDYAPLRIAQLGTKRDLLKTKFRGEIDCYDSIFRENEAPINEKYAKYDTILKFDHAACNMNPILNGSHDEVLIIKSVTHREINAIGVLVYHIV
ncbi:Sialyltransferase-like protein 1, partial [Mucuna pruriens]